MNEEYSEYLNYPAFRWLLMKLLWQCKRAQSRKALRFVDKYNRALKVIFKSVTSYEVKVLLIGYVRKDFENRLKDIKGFLPDEIDRIKSYIKARWRDYVQRKKGK